MRVSRGAREIQRQGGDYRETRAGSAQAARHRLGGRGLGARRQNQTLGKRVLVEHQMPGERHRTRQKIYVSTVPGKREENGASSESRGGDAALKTSASLPSRSRVSQGGQRATLSERTETMGFIPAASRQLRRDLGGLIPLFLRFMGGGGGKPSGQRLTKLRHFVEAAWRQLQTLVTH